MSRRSEDDSKNPPRDARAPDGRKKRLAAALRNNLRRRKAQARGRAEADAPPDTAADESKDGR
jgi:hypothetical protein